MGIYVNRGNDRASEEAYIPNEEVRAAFAGAVQGTDWMPVIQAMQQSEQLLALKGTLLCD